MAVNTTENPICAACGSTMSERPRGFFCPRCIERSGYVKPIMPSDPDHPAFYDDLEENPEKLEGHEVMYSSHGQKGGDFIGIITDVNKDFNHVEIIDRPGGPFESTSRLIKRKKFIEMLHEVSEPMGSELPDEDEVAFIMH